MPETTPLIKAALNLRVGVGFDVYVNSALVQRNWLIGYRIAEEELQGDNRAEYGASIIKKLAKELTAEYGKGYTKTNLYHFYSFYKTYPEIFHSASGKLLLSWTH